MQVHISNKYWINQRCQKTQLLTHVYLLGVKNDQF
jgi:hypothetical protein